MEVGQLRHNPNRTNDSKRSCQNAVGNTGHHITTAGRDFINSHGQANIVLLDPVQLRRGQTVTMHYPTRTFQTNEYFICRRCNGQYSCYFLT